MIGLWEKIDALRKSRGLSITGMEREIGLKTDAIRNIRRGKSKDPKGTVIYRIANHYDLEPGLFLEQDVSIEEFLSHIGDTEDPSAGARNDFAIRLAALRVAQRLTPAEFAERIGIDPDDYGELEDGERDPSIDELRRLSDRFAANPDFLVNGREPMILGPTQ